MKKVREKYSRMFILVCILLAQTLLNSRLLLLENGKIIATLLHRFTACFIAEQGQ